MLRATLIVASRVPNEGATSGSNAGVVKLSTNRVLYSARSIHWQRERGRKKIIRVFIRIKVHRKTQNKGPRTTNLVQKDLAAVWSEVLQSCECFAQYLQQTTLHRQQGLLLSLLPSRLPSTSWLLRRGVRRPLCSRQRAGGQRFSIFNLEKKKKKSQKVNKVHFHWCFTF